jgi:hypothetical protein
MAGNTLLENHGLWMSQIRNRSAADVIRSKTDLIRKARSFGCVTRCSVTIWHRMCPFIGGNGYGIASAELSAFLIPSTRSGTLMGRLRIAGAC